MKVVELSQVDEGLPWRLSVIPGTEDYDDEARHRLSGRISVFLNGKELPDVAGWNAEEGVVIRNRRYKDGRLILADGGVPIVERLKGRVEVRWAEKNSAPVPGPGAAA
jgi:hypothetical protein